MELTSSSFDVDELDPGITRGEPESAMARHIIDQASMVGLFSSNRRLA